MTIRPTGRSVVLRRIADSNCSFAPGNGLGPDHFVPAFTLNNRSLASRLKERLTDENISATIQVERLGTRFFVARESLSSALRIREEFLTQNPDAKLRRFSRDYDSAFLLTPFLLLAVCIALSSPVFPKYLWIAIAVSGITVMIFAERVHRQYRYYVGLQFGTRDLIFATAAVAVNMVIWIAIL